MGPKLLMLAGLGAAALAAVRAIAPDALTSRKTQVYPEGTTLCRRFLLKGEPKSGTTWVEVIVDELVKVYIANNPGASSVGILAPKGERDRLVMRSPNDMRPATFSVRKKHSVIELGFTHPDGFPDRLPHPVNEFAVAKAADNLGDRCLLWVVRDPRDVVVSECYHRFADQCRPNEYVLSKISFAASWMGLRKRLYDIVASRRPRSIQLLLFDRLKSDTVGAVRNISEFMGLPLTEAQCQEVARATTVEAMRRTESARELPGPNNAGKANAKVRRGSACGFLEEISGRTAKLATQTMEGILPPDLRAEWDCGLSGHTALG